MTGSSRKVWARRAERKARGAGRIELASVELPPGGSCRKGKVVGVCGWIGGEIEEWGGTRKGTMEHYVVGVHRLETGTKTLCAYPVRANSRICVFNVAAIWGGGFLIRDSFLL